MAASLHDVGEERHETRPLDGLGEKPLLAGGNGSDARRHDLAALGNEALQELHVLVVDLRRIGAREGARLLAAKEGTALSGLAHCCVSCVVSAPSSLRSPSRS